MPLVNTTLNHYSHNCFSSKIISVSFEFILKWCGIDICMTCSSNSICRVSFSHNIALEGHVEMPTFNLAETIDNK